MVRHRIANPTLRKGRVGSTPTLSANTSGHGASGNTYPCQGQVAGSIPAARSIIIKPDLYPYSGSADAKTGWAALTGFVRFLTQKYLTPI